MSESIEDLVKAAVKQRELAAIEHLDFDIEDPCKIRQGSPTAPICGEKADWAFVCIDCAKTVVVCTEHRRMMVDRKHRTFMCTDCHRRGPLFFVVRCVPYGRHR